MHVFSSSYHDLPIQSYCEADWGPSRNDGQVRVNKEFQTIALAIV
jgi:hypothetical protein